MATSAGFDRARRRRVDDLVVGPDFGHNARPSARKRIDRRLHMQTETFVDAVTAVTPILTEAHPADARMQMTGTLRQRGTIYLIEQRLDLNTGPGPHWTTPRIHRVMATDATRDLLRANIDQVVTIGGTAGGGDERNRTSIVIDSIQPFDATSSQV